MKVTKDVLKQINEDPTKFFKSNKLDDLEKLYLKAKDAYFNSDSLLFSDAIFDLLEEYIINKINFRVMTSLAVYFERFRVIFGRYFHACN